MVSSRPSYWLLLITIVLLPWYVVRFDIGGVPLTLLEVFLLTTVVVWVAELFISCRAGKGSLLKWWNEVKSPMVISGIVLAVIFVAAATLSLIISEDLRAALGIYKAYIVEPLLLSLVALSVVKTKQDWMGVVVAMSLVVAQVVLLVLSQKLFGWPVFAPAEMAQGRPSATFNTANAIGLLIGPISLFLASVGLGKLKIARSVTGWWLILTALTGVVAIWLSQSDGAVLAIVGAVMVGVALWLIRRYLADFRIRHVMLGAIAVYVLSTVGFMWLVNNPPEVDNPYSRPGFTTFTIRQCVWEGTVASLEKSPILGNGLASFTENYLDSATCDAEPLVYPHNLVLNFWTELGLLGVLSVLGLLGWWLILAGRSVINGGMQGYVGLGAVLVAVYWLVHGLVDVPYFKNDLAVAWWLLIVVAVIGVNLVRSEASSA